MIPTPPPPSSVAVRNVMRANAVTRTLPEVRLGRELWSRGLRYRRAKSVHVGEARVRPDFVFGAQRVAVFVDGCFWHSCPVHGSSPKTHSTYWLAKLRANLSRDERVRHALVANGWAVVEVWEHESAVEAAMRIATTLAERVT